MILVSARGDLDAIARNTRRWDQRPTGHGRVIAVCGGRGGAGTTFVATHLVAAFASLGASSVLMYQFGRLWFGRVVGLASALLLQVIPVYYVMGFVATMDGPLIFLTR